MKKVFSIVLISLSLLTAFTACSNDDDDNTVVCILPPHDGQLKFELDADSIPHSPHMNAYSQEAFEKNFCGKGWECLSVAVINNDGWSSRQNLVGSLLGWGPTHYYIGSGGRATAFFYSDAHGYVNNGLFYRDTSWTYSPATNTLRMGDGTEMQIVYVTASANDGFCYVLSRWGKHANGTPVYVVSLFRMMTEERLAEIRKQHSADWQTVEKQP